MGRNKNPAQINHDQFATPLAVWLAAALLALAAHLAYFNSLRGPFVFDDVLSIVQNKSIHSLRTALTPPRSVGETVSGRPVLNVSFALNYAWSGLAVRGFHLANLLIHTVAGLFLFGLVRRTLLRPGLRERWGPVALPLALVVALVWLLHPLQTESVTYVVQRAESLNGLFYLLTLYAFVRSVDLPRPGRWQVLSVAACLLGMGTKEVMVSAPLLVLLYDRTFVSGGFAAAWRSRGRYFLGLAATWLLLGWLVAAAGSRGTTAGLNTEITPGNYALTQCQAIGLYLKLAIWPAPLVFDYGTDVVKNFTEVWPQALTLVLLAAGTIMALWRKPALGFLGVWFFALLAPSSSVVPVATQTMAEHRMYLALAAVVTAAVLGVHVRLGRKSLVLWFALAMGFCFLTGRRNEDYRSEEAIWRDTVTKRPGNARAHSNLGVVLHESGRSDEALEEYRTALRLKPAYSEAHSNLGVAFFQLGRVEESVAEFREALRLMPRAFDANYNLATILSKQGLVQEALPLFEAAHRVKQDDASLQNNYGDALYLSQRLPEAGEHYAAAIRLDPGNAEAHNNLGVVLTQLSRLAEARTQFQEALRLRPDYPMARQGLAQVDQMEQAARPSR